MTVPVICRAITAVHAPTFVRTDAAAARMLISGVARCEKLWRRLNDFTVLLVLATVATLALNHHAVAQDPPPEDPCIFAFCIPDCPNYNPCVCAHQWACDSDGDGTVDSSDGCPNDPAKTAPGICGCGVADTDSDNDGTADCIDGCPEDLNRNGTVEGGDLAILLGAWGNDAPSSDITGDGQVDGADLATLLGAWGTCVN